MKTVRIFKNKPIPPRRNAVQSPGRTPRPISKYPLGELQVGDAFIAGPYNFDFQQNEMQYCSRSFWAEYEGHKYASRKINNDLVIWRIR